MLTNATLLAATGILSQGCASNNFATLDAAGKALPQAQYQVLGQTKYDQTWIDKTIEAEVAGFGMKRPQARPASLKTAPKSTKVVVRPATPAAAPGPSSGGTILLPTPRSETQQPSPAKPETITVARPAKKSTTQRLRAELEALKVKIRKLEGR